MNYLKMLMVCMMMTFVAIFGLFGVHASVADDVLCTDIKGEGLVATDVSEFEYVQCLKGFALQTIGGDMYVDGAEVKYGAPLPDRIPGSDLVPVGTSPEFGAVYRNPRDIDDGVTAGYEDDVVPYATYLAWLILAMLVVWGMKVTARKEEEA